MAAKGKFRIWTGGGSKGLMFWCPGCDHIHSIVIEGSNAWGFNQDYDQPTITPSILVTAPHRDDGSERCHSFITNGKIQFLSDCSHKLKDQTVDLPGQEVWPKWFKDEADKD